MSVNTSPENFNVNKKDFDLIYGADGFLYAKQKSNGEMFAFFQGEWYEIQDVYEIMQGVLENNLEFDVDNES